MKVNGTNHSSLLTRDSVDDSPFMSHDLTCRLHHVGATFQPQMTPQTGVMALCAARQGCSSRQDETRISRRKVQKDLPNPPKMRPAGLRPQDSSSVRRYHDLNPQFTTHNLALHHHTTHATFAIVASRLLDHALQNTHIFNVDWIDSQDCQNCFSAVPHRCPGSCVFSKTLIQAVARAWQKPNPLPEQKESSWSLDHETAVPHASFCKR